MLVVIIKTTRKDEVTERYKGHAIQMEETEIAQGRRYLVSRAERKPVCVEHGEWQELNLEM